MRDFQKLELWQKSHCLTLKIHTLTKSFPIDERFGLIIQMRRSSASIPTNIAEGCGRNTRPQLVHFFQISAGSASELLYQVILSKDLGYISDDIYKELFFETTSVMKMIRSYSEKLI